MNITVNATPAVGTTVTPGNTVCNGTPVNMAGSGASTYQWSPSTYLSTTTGPTTVSTPTASITYNLLGIGANGCSTNVTIPITVLNAPVATFAMSDTFICVNGTINYDGSNSTDATSFSWSFPGGTPSTSTASSPSVTYNTVGTYTAQLIVTNSCGTDTINYLNVGVGCAGVTEYSAEWNAFYSPAGEVLQVNSPARTSAAPVMIMNSLGQIVYSGTMQAGTNVLLVDMSNQAAGMYTLMVNGESNPYTLKFVVQ